MDYFELEANKTQQTEEKKMHPSFNYLEEFRYEGPKKEQLLDKTFIDRPIQIAGQTSNYQTLALFFFFPSC